MRDTASYRMNCVYNVETPMRDGTVLRGDLYTPQAEGAYPLLLLRTIFRKETMGRAFGQYDPAGFVKHGYAVFIQDARGLGQSDGEFDRFTADGPDGYDTVEWLAAQHFCNGRIGMMGSYYAGYLQLMAAAEQPPHLRAVCPMQTSVSINRDCDNRGFMFFSHIGWNMSRLCNRLMDGRYDRDTCAKWLPQFQAWIGNYPVSQLSVWPTRDMPAVKDTPFPQMKDYFHHLVEGFDSFDLLHKEGRDMDLTKVQTPAYYISGWYDSSRTPLIAHCLAQRSAGVDSRVLIAPWQTGEAPAPADSALESGDHAVDLVHEMLAWFDHWLKGIPMPATQPIRYYDIVTRSSVEGTEWPPCRTESSVLYLDEAHALTAERSDVHEGADQYRHDPRHPLAYRGYGAAGVWSPTNDARIVEYVSAPARKSRRVLGIPTADIWLSSTAKDADVMVSLSDLAPDGSRFVIADGATRARYRDGWEPKTLAPGEVVPVRILLGNVCYMLREGHRLLVQLCGSAFPKYDVNHGTGCRPADDADWVESVQQIRRGGACDSRITLPMED